MVSGRVGPHSIHFGITEAEFEELQAAGAESKLFLQRALQWEEGRREFWEENGYVFLSFFAASSSA